MTVCILGNNLTALTLAKALVNQNIHVDHIHTKKNSTPDQTRTIGISKSNTDYFNKNIINIEKLLWKLKKIEIFSDNLNKEKLLNFEKSNEQLFSIIKNYDLYKILKHDLYNNKYFKSKISNNNKLSFIDKYQLIINCDSSNQITRKYFTKKIIKSYNGHAFTTIIKHRKILNNAATQIFTKKGPLAFLPISNRETSIVYSVHNSIDKKKENIRKLIEDKNFKYEIININKINSFKLSSMNLRSYYHNNILAFGDLLHRVHPLAGQGFNMTIRDIKLLLNIIKNKKDVGLPLDSSVNFEFQNTIKHKNYIFSSGVDLIHEFFNLERKMKNNFLSKSVQAISKYPLINRMFEKIADRGILF